MASDFGSGNGPADGGSHGSVAIVERHRDSGHRLEIGEVSRDEPNLYLLAERTGKVQSRMRQRNKRWAENDGLRAAVVISLQAARHRNAPRPGCRRDREVGAPRKVVGI